MTLPGPSRTIIVQPIEQPAPPEPAPEPSRSASDEPRAREPAGARARARPRARAGRGSLNTATTVASDETPLIAGRIHGIRVWSIEFRGGSASLHGVTGEALGRRRRADGRAAAAGHGGPARRPRHRAPEPDCGCGLYAVHPHAAETALVLSRRRVGPAQRDRRNRRGVGAGRGARGGLSGPVRAADRDRRRRGRPDSDTGEIARPDRSPVPRRAGRGRRPHDLVAYCRDRGLGLSQDGRSARWFPRQPTPLARRRHASRDAARLRAARAIGDCACSRGSWAGRRSSGTASSPCRGDDRDRGDQRRLRLLGRAVLGAQAARGRAGAGALRRRTALHRGRPQHEREAGRGGGVRARQGARPRRRPRGPTWRTGQGRLATDAAAGRDRGRGRRAAGSRAPDRARAVAIPNRRRRPARAGARCEAPGRAR